MIKHIFFDLDSTLVSFEGLDWLAARRGIAGKFMKITSETMEGKRNFSDTFEEKVSLLAPKPQDLIDLAAHYRHNLVADAHQVISALQALDKHVGILTNNFYPALYQVTSLLNIPQSLVIANNIIYDNNDAYSRIKYHPLLKPLGSKANAIKKLRGKHSQLVMVGDSVGDLETKPYVKLFIGYGGVVTRPKVKQSADAFVICQSMAALLPVILSPQELTKVPPKLHRKAQALIDQGQVVYN